MIGQTIAHYRVTAKLGEGGMGEVYRATDTKLHREVAIKVLPPSFAQDAERMARFTREAQVLASLNHPNIAQIYGVEDHALVMELVEGEALKGPLPVETALDFGRQIVDALEAAHEKGIVHRDLKPANIKVTPQGVVKVLDFGLAKAAEEPKGDAEHSPTLTISPTRAGLILGTAAYMSPEQARGKAVDKRADIWAFGVVLYEMLTGERLFKGETISDTLAAVLKEETDLERVPAKVQRLLRKCLEKDPKRRLRDIADAWELLEDARPIAPTRSMVIPALTAVAGVLLIGLGILAYIRLREKPPDALVERFSIPAPEKTTFSFTGVQGGPVDVSPDGRRLVFSAATADGKSQLWVRALASLTSVPLAGTEGASFPFWSPDSQKIGFFADGKLKRIDAAGGLPLTLCDAPNGFGGTWNRDGVIVFAPNGASPLHRVSASGGGTSSPVTVIDSARREVTHRWPWFLPDGKHFLYWAGTAAMVGTIRVASIDSPGRDFRVIMPSPYNALYSQGHLLFLRDFTLMAQPFDPKRLATTADAVPVAEQLLTLPIQGRAVFAVSASGLLVYRLNRLAATSGQLAWFDQSGKQIATFGQPDNVTNVNFSPDRRSVAVDIYDLATRNSDIWLYEVARELKTRFTFHPAEERTAIWSPDGKSIVFNSNRKGHFDLYRKSSSGVGTEELLYADDKEKYPTSFSPDGRWLLYMINLDPKNQLRILPMEGAPAGGRTPVPFPQSEFNSTWGEFSPDGRWIAYASDQSHRNEIYVAPFPGPGGKRQISIGGGDQPVWRNDGKEIFYIGADRRLMVAEVSSKGDVMELGAVRHLFVLISTYPGHNYDVSADGQRFLVRTSVQQTNPEPLTVVRNWDAELKK